MASARAPSLCSLHCSRLGPTREAPLCGLNDSPPRGGGSLPAHPRARSLATSQKTPSFAYRWPVSRSLLRPQSHTRLPAPGSPHRSLRMRLCLGPPPVSLPDARPGPGHLPPDAIDEGPALPAERRLPQPTAHSGLVWWCGECACANTHSTHARAHSDPDAHAHTTHRHGNTHANAWAQAHACRCTHMCTRTSVRDAASGPAEPGGSSEWPSGVGHVCCLPAPAGQFFNEVLG